MEHELLICAEWPREGHPGQFDAAGRVDPQQNRRRLQKEIRRNRV